MPKHALLSASASHRWLICPPSAKLCADIKDEASPYAKQGTDAHSLCEFKVLTALGQRPPDPTEDLDYFDQEMAYCTDEYCSYVMEQLTEAKTHCKDPQVLVEQRLDFSKWVPEGFGTGDCLIVADDVLHIIDFKYGLGVLVEAEDNPQMMCYALGALDIYDGIYDITSVKMTIFQPPALPPGTHHSRPPSKHRVPASPPSTLSHASPRPPCRSVSRRRFRHTHGRQSPSHRTGTWPHTTPRTEGAATSRPPPVSPSCPPFPD